MTRPPLLASSLLLLLALAAPAAAQDKKPWDYDQPAYSRDPDHPDYTPYSPFYTGAFLAAGAFAGPSLLGGDALDSATALTAGAWLQASSPTQVLDGRFTWYGTSADLTAQGDPLQLRQDTFALTAGGHPFFLTHLENNRLFYTLAGAYLLFGVDLTRSSASTPTRDHAAWDLGVLLGAGLDTPLDDPDDGGALWLGLQYVYNPWDLDLGGGQTLDVGQHLLVLQLGYRRNGLAVVVPASPPW